MTEQTLSGSDAAASDRTLITFEHWFFHKMEDIVFHQAEVSGEPMMTVKYAKNDVAMTFQGVMREFKIDPDGVDGAMLDLVSRGLRYVKGLRIGDAIPREVLTREASWELSERHLRIAYQRVSLQLVNWMTGGQSMITDPDELLQLAEDPQIKKSVSAAFAEAAEKLGLGRDRKEDVILYVQELAKELAYIEALRDRFRHIRTMEQKIQTLRRVYGPINAPDWVSAPCRKSKICSSKSMRRPARSCRSCAIFRRRCLTSAISGMIFIFA
jgi:hypothetical protein